MSRQAVLLVNLGSPDSPDVPDVRRYLKEFLSDPRVMDAPWPIRQFVLHTTILPTRPRNTAEAYRKIWTNKGSPLVVISQRVQSLLQEKVDLPVELAMRYGKPSIPDVLQQMIDQKIDEILLIPLYPHYAMSSYETAVVKVREGLAKKGSHVRLKVLPPFYQEPDYLQALVASAEKDLRKEYDHLLISFHGLPERHLKLSDPSKAHCLIQENCCSTPHPAHEFCYRSQVLRTAEEFAQLAGIPKERYSVSFQSRLARDIWLRPYTDHVLAQLPSQGIKRLLIMAPAFVSDCLETLEELGIRGRETFLDAGGKEYTLIPCLNDHPQWIETLRKYVMKEVLNF